MIEKEPTKYNKILWSLDLEGASLFTWVGSSRFTWFGFICVCSTSVFHVIINSLVPTWISSDLLDYVKSTQVHLIRATTMFAEGKSFIHFILYIYICVHLHLHLAPTFIFFAPSLYPFSSNLQLIKTCLCLCVAQFLYTTISIFFPLLLSIPIHSPVHYRAESSDLQGRLQRDELCAAMCKGEREREREQGEKKTGKWVINSSYEAASQAEWQEGGFQWNMAAHLSRRTFEAVWIWYYPLKNYRKDKRRTVLHFTR